MAGRRAIDQRCLAWPLDDHAVAGERQSGGQQFGGVGVVADQRADQAHFLFDQCAFVAVGKHRIEVDHLRDGFCPLAQK